MGLCCVQNLHERFSRDGFVFIQIGCQLVQLAAIVFQNRQRLLMLPPYKCDDLYDPSSERGMRYDDPAIGIPWPDVGMKPILSEKDTRHPGLAEIEPWRG